MYADAIGSGFGHGLVVLFQFVLAIGGFQAAVDPARFGMSRWKAAGGLIAICLLVASVAGAASNDQAGYLIDSTREAGGLPNNVRVFTQLLTVAGVPFLLGVWEFRLSKKGGGHAE
jgi:hypothetical protein